MKKFLCLFISCLIIAQTIYTPVFAEELAQASENTAAEAVTPTPGQELSQNSASEQAGEARGNSDSTSFESLESMDTSKDNSQKTDEEMKELDSGNLVAAGPSIDIARDPELDCGIPTVFRLNIRDGNFHDAEYHLADLTYYDELENAWVPIVNINNFPTWDFFNNGNATTNDEFTFTFHSPGKYRISFSALCDGNTTLTATSEFEILPKANYTDVNSKAREIVRQCVQDLAAQGKTSEYDKAMWLHDWIINNAEINDIHNIYIGAEAILCERGEIAGGAYSNTYIKLLKTAGIPCARIASTANNSAEVSWTAVNLDGKWYQVHVEGDDPLNKNGSHGLTSEDIAHRFFCVTDEFMALNYPSHKDTYTSSGYSYRSSSYENNYFVKTGRIKQWLSPVQDEVQSNIAAGKTDFTIEISNTIFADIIYNIIAYQLSNMSWNKGDNDVALTARYDMKGNPFDGTLVFSAKYIQPASAIYNGVDYSAVYDHDYYIANNPDVLNAFHGDREATLVHFINHGMAEGRLSKRGFNVLSYKNRYSDLRTAFGKDIKSYYMHFVNYGSKEGRTAAGSNDLLGATTVYNGVDYSAVYDYDYYIANNPDVKKAFKGDDEATLAHFINYGMAEGRASSPNFSADVYRNRYPDLRHVYGRDTKSYYMHFVVYGHTEGRTATGSGNVVNAITSLNGVDYSLVYDYNCYIKHNPDVEKAFNGDDMATLAHFVNYGMNEGRVSSPKFNVDVYKNKYSDLRTAFGNNLKSYYLHYINYGYKENREAI